MSDLISVIVPVYNVEKYIRKCVESICEQTYKNLEIILVNDGSTDASGKICDELAEEDERISVIHQKNEGLSRARNAGLDKAKGDYIAFVDSDDYLSLNMYECLLKSMKENNADVVRCGIKNVHEGEKVEKIEIVDSIVKLPLAEMIDGLSNRRTRLVVWNALYKKEIISELRFVPDVIYEDVFFTNAILKKKHAEILVNAPFYRYLVKRDGNTNTSKFIPDKRLPVLNEFLDMLDWICKDPNVQEEDFQSFVRYCLNFTIELFLLAVMNNTDMNTLNTIHIYFQNMIKKWDFSFSDKKFRMKMKIFYTHPISMAIKYRLTEKIKIILKRGNRK